MKAYKLRVTLTGGVKYEDILDIVQQYSPEVYMGCYEVSKNDKPHSHWYLELDCSAESVRARIRALAGKGNRIYSMKALDEKTPIKYLAYLLKDGDCVIQGIPEDILQQAVVENARIKDDIITKKKQPKVFEILLEECNHLMFCDHDPRVEVSTIVVNYYIREQKLINFFQLKNIVQTIMVNLRLENKQHLISRLCDDL